MYFGNRRLQGLLKNPNGVRQLAGAVFLKN
jgi:hypothetical protein